jgi:hypothetical protein
MLSKKFITNLLPLIFLLLAVNSHGQSLVLGSTLFWWFVYFLALLIFWTVFYKYTAPQLKLNFKIIQYYLLYVLCSSLWGATLAKTYWDWKNLIFNTMVLLIPLCTYLVNNKYLFQHIIRQFIFLATPFFIIFQFFISTDEFGFYLAPYCFFLLFLPMLPIKLKLLILSIAFYIIFADFGARATILKFVFPILISFLFYYRKKIKIKYFNFLTFVFMFIPFIFFILGSLNVFNIFNPQGDSTVEVINKKKSLTGEIEYDNLLSDTRTFIYFEVLSTAKEYNTWILGRSPALGYKSDFFGAEDENNRNERNGNEVGILNYFNWLGIVGFLFIFCIYFKAAYLAINYSNNYLSKSAGIYIAYRWVISWIEDYNSFYIGFVFLWLMIGFCFSPIFRKMSDSEMRDWVLNIFKFKNRSLR